MHRATGTKKNLLLTLWLFLPFAVLAAIVAVIFISYGNPKMDARPVGAGAGDTGAANALGQLLAGRDPDEIERIAKDLREGRLIDPLDWPEGIRIEIEESDTAPKHIWIWSGVGGPTPTRAGSQHLTADMIVGRSKTYIISDLSRSQLRAIFTEGRPGAGIYLASSALPSEANGTLRNADGSEAFRINLSPVPVDQTSPGRPISIRAN